MTRGCVVVIALLFYVPVIAQTLVMEGYKGIVSESESRKVGDQFTFANLSSDKPFVTYPSGFGGETIKVFENDQLVVLIVVAQLTGSTEIFYLSKKARRFTLIEITTFDSAFNPNKFAKTIVHPKVTYGNYLPLQETSNQIIQK